MEMDTTVYKYQNVPAGNYIFLVNLSTAADNSTSTEFNPPEPFYDPWLVVLLYLLAGIVSVCTVIGNVMVLIAFIMEKSIRQPANYLIASLAVTDIIIGGSSMPLYTVYILKAYWPLGDITCDLWLSLDYTVCLVSQYTVFLITLDRFCSVKVPTNYRNWRTPCKMKVMVTVTWIVPAIIFFASIMGWHHFEADSRTQYECSALFQQNPMFSAILVICYYWVTLVIMIGQYVGIYKVALNLQQRSKAAKKRIQAQTKNCRATPSAQEQERLLHCPSETAGTTLQTSENSNGMSKPKSANKAVIATAESVASLLKAQPCSDNSSQSPSSELRKPLSPPTLHIETCEQSATPPQTLAIGESTKDGANRQLQIPVADGNAESPVWKPRGSLPNLSIHWDAFTGQTLVKMEKAESHESNCESTVSPSPVLAQRRLSKKNRRAREASKSDYNDTSSESSESENKPTKVLGHLSNIATMLPAAAKIRTPRKKISSKKRSENRARKALRTISFILGAFVICWTPYHVLVLVGSFCTTCKIHPRLWEISYWLCYMNSPINPFCYALSNPQFKKSFLRIIKLTYVRNCWRKLQGH